MQIPQWLKAVGVIGFLCLVTAVGGAQASAVEWKVPPDVSARDRRAILEVARRAGIKEPQSVSVPIRSPCLLVNVESTPTVSGDRVLTTVVGVRQFHGPQCSVMRGDRQVERQGNWIAFLGPLNPHIQERWRIRDDNWHVDITLGDNVPYEDAVAIVSAIRQKKLVDRRSVQRGTPAPIQDIDPNTIGMISKSVPSPAITRQYEIRAGSEGGGPLLTVRIEGRDVELLREGNWTP